MTTRASSSAEPAATAAAVHAPPEEEPVAAAAACSPGPAAFTVPLGVAEACGTLLSGGTSVPTGCTVGAALKPQSSSDAASR
jgi:hypothetical protein